MNGASFSLVGVVAKLGIMGQTISALIFILSIVAVYVFVERMIVLKSKNGDRTLFQKINEMMSEGNFQSAKELCIRHNSPLSRVLYKGLLRIGMPTKEIQSSMEKEIELEIFKMEKGEDLLSLIAKMAPMLGFIGTIAGVIQIFYTINTTGDYNIESISGGLYVKMITSALGLSLGILAYFFYFLVNKRINKNIYELEKGSISFIDSITVPVNQ